MAAKKTVDDYIAGADRWHDELTKLRRVLTSAGLDEAIKWGAPCYVHAGKNVVGIGAFKSYCGLWFFQGAALPDPDGVLINAQQGKTKAMRQWRFQNAREIKVTRVRDYVKAAIEHAASGQQIGPERNKPLTVPAELEAALKENRKAKTAFAKLTKGRQREYADYIASAKRDATKTSRLKKILPLIAAGKGLNDKYRC